MSPVPIPVTFVGRVSLAYLRRAPSKKISYVLFRHLCDSADLARRSSLLLGYRRDKILFEWPGSFTRIGRQETSSLLTSGLRQTHM
jgi:hypothetical protein